jgi:hypothetical protein
MEDKRTSWLLMILISCIILFTYAALYKAGASRITAVVLDRDESNGIPSIVHFVVGQFNRAKAQNGASSTSSFTFFHYTTVLAARRHLRPNQLFVHYHHEPTTFWWKKMICDTEINATLIKTRLVRKIFTKPVDLTAHRADIIRLEALMKYGGIYLDLDVLVFRSFDSLLNQTDIVMGYENEKQNHVCNAVILARRNAPFLQRWYDAYQSFDGNCWGCHSVKLPGQLAYLYPNEITVLSMNAFFQPSWTEPGKFHRSNDYNFTSNYASHMWNTINKAELDRLSPERAMRINTTFGRMLRHAIGTSTLLQLQQAFLANSLDSSVIYQ